MSSAAAGFWLQGHLVTHCYSAMAGLSPQLEKSLNVRGNCKMSQAPENEGRAWVTVLDPVPTTLLFLSKEREAALTPYLVRRPVVLKDEAHVLYKPLHLGPAAG